MKFIAVFTFIVLSCTVSAQQWRVELKEGNRLYEEGNYQEAYNHFITAQQHAPENIDLSREISRAAYRKGEFKEAEENYYNQLQDAKSTEDKAALYHNMGNCNMKDKNYAEAVENYKNALRMNPSAKETRYNLAEAKRRLKKQEEQQQKNQNQQDQQNQQQQQNQDQNQDSQQQQKQDQQSQNGQNQQDNNPSNDPQNKSNNTSSSNSSPQQSDKLSSKKTERLLDELMKQEMNTKRKLRGMGSGGKQEKVKSGKRW